MRNLEDRVTALERARQAPHLPPLDVLCPGPEAEARGFWNLTDDAARLELIAKWGGWLQRCRLGGPPVHITYPSPAEREMGRDTEERVL